MKHIQQQREDIVLNNLSKWQESLTEKEKILYLAGWLKAYKYTSELAAKIRTIPLDAIKQIVTLPNHDKTKKRFYEILAGGKTFEP